LWLKNPEKNRGN